jgi:hypothetical protein
MLVRKAKKVSYGPKHDGWMDGWMERAGEEELERQCSAKASSIHAEEHNWDRLNNIWISLQSIQLISEYHPTWR